MIEDHSSSCRIMFQLSLISTIFLLSSFIIATEAIKCYDGKGLNNKPVECGKGITQCSSSMLEIPGNYAAVSLKTSSLSCDTESKCKDIDRYNSMSGVQYVKAENVSFEESFGITQKDWDTKMDFKKTAAALEANPSDAASQKNFMIAVIQSAKLRMKCCNTDLCNSVA